MIINKIEFTYSEVCLVRCDGGDLDWPWFRWIRFAKNGSWHFRDQRQPPGEPST